MMRRMMRRRIVIQRKIGCCFCKEGKEPKYQEPETLLKFVTDRGRILGKDQTGLCSKHQRMLTVAVKRARHLGLLPFVSG